MAEAGRSPEELEGVTLLGSKGVKYPHDYDRCKLVCSSLHGGVASASSGPCGACAPARFALRRGLPRDHGALRSHVPSTRV
jgi:hypothetical protein